MLIKENWKKETLVAQGIAFIRVGRKEHEKRNYESDKLRQSNWRVKV